MEREEKAGYATLKQIPCGKTVKVVKLHGEGALRRRIMDMGITKGTEVFVRKWRLWATPWRSLSAAMSFLCAGQTRK